MVKIEVPEIVLRPGEKIPRLIHYCWFGGNPMPALTKRCIRSWKKNLPGYVIMLWDENNFDLDAHVYTSEAFKSEKWAFVSDYVRLYLLYNFGGIYLDADVEIIKPIDRFLIHSAFSSFESATQVPTGLMGSSRYNNWIKTLLDYYEDHHFLDSFGSPVVIPNTVVISEISHSRYNLILNNTYQVLEEDVHLYPSDYFCPMNWEKQRIEVTSETYAIHHFAGSWVDGRNNTKSIKIRKKIGRLAAQIFGIKIYSFIADNTWRKYLKLP